MGADAGGSHVHCCPVDGLGTRLCPCGIATATPQTIHRGLQAQAMETLPGVPRPTSWEKKAGAHRKPARIHRVRAGGPSRGVTQPVSLVYLPVLLTATFPSCSPRPAHPAVPSRRDFVEAAPALPGDPRLRLPPASPRRYDDEEMDGLSPPSGTAAPRGAPISGPLTPVTSGLSRSLAETPPRRSGHVTGPDSADSQADSAGSIPVTRSTAKSQVSTVIPPR